MFIHTNQPLITSFYIKKVPIFAELARSRRWSATSVWGGKPIGRVRVKIWKFLALYFFNVSLMNVIFRISSQTSLYVEILENSLSANDISSVGNPTCATLCKLGWVRLSPISADFCVLQFFIIWNKYY